MEAEYFSINPQNQFVYSKTFKKGILFDPDLGPIVLIFEKGGLDPLLKFKKQVVNVDIGVYDSIIEETRKGEATETEIRERLGLPTDHV